MLRGPLGEVITREDAGHTLSLRVPVDNGKRKKGSFRLHASDWLDHPTLNQSK